MDTNTTVAATAIGALVATSVTLVVATVQKAKDAKAEQAALAEADRMGHMRGWYEGRESILQKSFESVTPQDIIR